MVRVFVAGPVPLYVPWDSFAISVHINGIPVCPYLPKANTLMEGIGEAKGLGN